MRKRAGAGGQPRPSGLQDSLGKQQPRPEGEDKGNREVNLICCSLGSLRGIGFPTEVVSCQRRCWYRAGLLHPQFPLFLALGQLLRGSKFLRPLFPVLCLRPLSLSLVLIPSQGLSAESQTWTPFSVVDSQIELLSAASGIECGFRSVPFSPLTPLDEDGPQGSELANTFPRNPQALDHELLWF